MLLRFSALTRLVYHRGIDSAMACYLLSLMGHIMGHTMGHIFAHYAFSLRLCLNPI